MTAGQLDGALHHTIYLIVFKPTLSQYADYKFLAELTDGICRGMRDRRTVGPHT